MSRYETDAGAETVSRWAEPPDPAMYADERDLWVAVIMQAIDDATRDWPTGSGKWTRAVYNIMTAREWLLGMSRDFRDVSENADIDAGMMRKFALKLRDNRWKMPEELLISEDVTENQELVMNVA